MGEQPALVSALWFCWHPIGGLSFWGPVLGCLPMRLQGKKVVIIGGGKSAHDVALVTSSVAASTTLLARRGHWMAPQIVLGERPSCL